MVDDSVSTPEITDYLRNHIVQKDEFLKELEELALKEYIPIIQPEVVQLIKVIFKAANVKNVLEIGTAIGYSAINFAYFTGGKITTVERSPEMVEAARKNIEKCGMNDRIEVVEGDALEVLRNISETYDCVFLDAAKGQYINFLPECLRILKPGGILVSDNVLYRGKVALDGFIPRKHRTIIRNLKEYIDEITSKLETTILPMGDGVAISTVK